MSDLAALWNLQPMKDFHRVVLRLSWFNPGGAGSHEVDVELGTCEAPASGVMTCKTEDYKSREQNEDNKFQFRTDGGYWARQLRRILMVPIEATAEPLGRCVMVMDNNHSRSIKLFFGNSNRSDEQQMILTADNLEPDLAPWDVSLAEHAVGYLNSGIPHDVWQVLWAKVPRDPL